MTKKSERQKLSKETKIKNACFFVGSKPKISRFHAWQSSAQLTAPMSHDTCMYKVVKLYIVTVTMFAFNFNTTYVVTLKGFNQHLSVYMD